MTLLLLLRGAATGGALLTTDFTGTNGAPWPAPWTTTSGTATIESNRGQQATPATQWSDCASRANLSVANGTAEATVRFPTLAGRSMRIDVRFDPNTGNGYRIIVPGDYNGFQLMKVTGWTETPVNERFDLTWAANTDYRIKFELNGSTLRARRWVVGATEPSTWDVSGTDATHTTGDIRLVTVTSTAASAIGLWDDVSISTTSTTPTTVTPLANPERGFFFYSETHAPGAAATTYNALSQATLESERTTNGRTLVFRYVILDQFLGTDTITQTFLNALAADLTATRNAGMKMILRFAYSNSGDMTPPYASDPPVARVLTHISQLAPTLNANADVIEALQAGFIGMWGEWYYTDNFGDLGVVTTQQWADRKSVVDSLFTNLDSRIFVLIRYVNVMRRLIDGDPTNTAYATRMGHHNDAFLAEAQDWGTYAEFPWNSYTAAGNRTWLANRNQTGSYPMGGETANLNSPRSDYPTASAEMSEYRWSFLNPNYHPDVLTSWGQTNRDDAAARLGYRHTVTAATATVNGSNVDLSLTIQNDGWAAGYRNRPVLVDFVSGGTTVTRTLSTDFRQWLPGVNTVTGSVAAPSAGTWSVHLRIVDASVSLQANPLYNVRLAGVTYDAATGRNALGQSVTTTTSGTTSGALMATASASVGNLGIEIVRTGVVASAGGAAAVLTGVRSQPGALTATGSASLAIGAVRTQLGSITATTGSTASVSGTATHPGTLTATAGASATTSISVGRSGVLTATTSASSLISIALTKSAVLSAYAAASPVLGSSLDVPWNGSDPWIPTDPWPGPHVVVVSTTLAAVSGASMLLGAQVVMSRALTATAAASTTISPAVQRLGTIVSSGTATTTISALRTANATFTSTAAASALIASRVDVYGAMVFSALASMSVAVVAGTSAALIASASAAPTIGVQLARVAQFTSTAGASASLTGAVTVPATLVASAAASATNSSTLTRTGVLAPGAVATAAVSAQVVIQPVLTSTAAASAASSGVVAGSVSLLITGAATVLVSPLLTIRPTLAATTSASGTISVLTSAALSATALASVLATGSRTTSGLVTATAAASGSVSVSRTVPAVFAATAVASPSVQVLGQTASTLTATAAGGASVASQVTRVAALTGQGTASAVLNGALSRALAVTSTAAASASISTLGQTVSTLTATALASASAAGALSRALALSSSAVATAQVSGIRTQASVLASNVAATAVLSGARTTAQAFTAATAASASIANVSLNGFVSLVATAAGSAVVGTVQFVRNGALTAGAAGTMTTRSSATGVLPATASASVQISGVRAQLSVLTSSASGAATIVPAISTSIGLTASAAGSALVQPLVRAVGQLAASAVALAHLVRTNQGSVQITATWTVSVSGEMPPTERYGSFVVPWRFSITASGQAPHIQVILTVRALQTRLTEVGALRSRVAEVESLQSRTVRVESGGVEV